MTVDIEHLRQVFGSDCLREGVDAKVPRVKWQESDTSPGVLSVYLCCKTKKVPTVGAFFYTMMANRFFPGKRLMIRRAQHTSFQLEKDDFYFGEIVIELTNKKDRSVVLERLPFMAQEIEMAVLSSAHMHYLLVLGEVIPHQKPALLRRDLARLHLRYPKKVSGEIFRELEHFNLAITQEFSAVRQSRHLSRIVAAFYMGRQEVLRTSRLFPKRRHLSLKLMHGELRYPFGTKAVLGIAIALGCDRDFERLDSEHIVEASALTVPDVEIVPGSFFDYQESGDPIRMIYLELQKKDGSNFLRTEHKRLHTELSVGLKGHIARLTHPLFYFRNEEEVLRRILTLSREIHTPDDLPQLVTSFQEQGPETLTFNTIMVRPIEKERASLLFLNLPSNISYQIEMEQAVGQVNKQVEKMAYVFTLTFDKRPFFRQNHAVDLLKARQFVIATISGLFGQVRDYNGGLILKQNEVLEGARVLLKRQERASEHLLENLFYSISPIVMQSYLQPEVVKAFFSLLLETIKNEPKRGKKYAMRFLKREDCHCVFVRAEDRTFKDEVERSVKELKFESLQLVTSFLTIYGSFYLGYICFGGSGSTKEQFRNTIEEALESWEKMRRSRQTLKLNLVRHSSSLDPRIGGDRRSGMLVQMLYEGLVQLDEKGRASLAGAEDITISDDRKTYIITLRENHWSNGVKVTARDFEYAWKKSLTLDFDSPFVLHYFNLIRNAMPAKAGKCPIDDVGIYARDDRTLIVELERPAPYFFSLLGHWIFSPLYHEIDRTVPDWAYSLGDAYVCNGPFKLTPAKNSGELRLIKNPHYWDRAAVRLERIQICSIQDRQTSIAMFEQKELDWVGDPICELPTEIFASPPKEGCLMSTPGSAIHWAYCNTESFPFTSKKMRKAFAYAVNRRELLDQAVYGYGEPALGLVPPTMSHSSGPKFLDGHRELALRLYDEALQEMGKTRDDMPPIVYRYFPQQDNEDVACVLAKQWHDVFGIKVITEQANTKFFYDLSGRSQDYHMAGGTFFPFFFDDPIYLFQSLRDRFQPFNLALWEYPGYHKLLDASDNCSDPEERRRLLIQIEDLLVDEMPAIPLYFPCYRYLIRSGLKEALCSDFGIINFKRAYIDNE